MLVAMSNKGLQGTDLAPGDDSKIFAAAQAQAVSCASVVSEGASCELAVNISDPIAIKQFLIKSLF
jgi:hypothetical protein